MSPASMAKTAIRNVDVAFSFLGEARRDMTLITRRPSPTDLREQDADTQRQDTIDFVRNLRWLWQGSDPGMTSHPKECRPAGSCSHADAGRAEINTNFLLHAQGPVSGCRR